MTAEPSTVPDGNIPPDQQADGAPTRRSGATLKYSAKVARRELRRRPWRAFLVVLLVALPTWIMVNVAAQVRTDLGSNDYIGPDFSSDLVVPFDDAPLRDPQAAAVANRTVGYNYTPTELTSADIEAALPSGSTTQRVIGGYSSVMIDDGSIRSVTFVKVDLATPAASTWAPLVEGRAPEAGEVVLDRNFAAKLDLGVGDTMRLREPEGEWLVVGLIDDHFDDLMVVRDFDESLLTVTAGSLLVELPTDIDVADVRRLEDELGGWAPAASRFAIDYPDGADEVGSVAVGWMAAFLLFLMFGVIIVAAFATIARGQLVTVGQLAANGATRAFTRRVMAMQGFWTGLAGVVVGGIAAIATMPFMMPRIVGSVGLPVEFAWNPIDVVVIALIGIAVAVAAAALPAVQLVKTSVLDALAGRRPEHPVPRWMVPVGAATFGLGLLLLVVSSTSSSAVGVVGAMLGSLAMVIGVCLVGPLVIQVAGRAAVVMPLSVRIALRGLGRSRLRSSAVVSSIAVTTGVMTVIVAGVQTDAGGPRPGDIADDVVFAVSWPSLEMRSVGGDALLDADGLPLPDNPAEIDEVALRWVVAPEGTDPDLVRSVLPNAATRPVRVAVRPDGVYDNRDGHFLAKVTEAETSEFTPGYGEIPPGVGPLEEIGELPLIADRATIEAFSLPESFVGDMQTAGFASAVPKAGCDDDGFIPDTWDGQPIQAAADAGSSLDPATIALIPVTGLDCYIWTGPFMTEEFAVDHGYQIVPAGTMFVNPDPLTPGERDRLTRQYTNPSMFVEWAYQGNSGFDQLPAAESSVVASSYFALAGVALYRPGYSAEVYDMVQFTMLGVAAFFVTFIAGIGLALAASDSRRDRAVMSVIGAKPGTQRRVAAMDAWTLVVIGTLLGVPAALFAARVVTVATKQDTPTGVPWLFVAGEFLVLPALVAGLMYLAGAVRRSVRPMSVLAVD